MTVTDNTADKKCKYFYFHFCWAYLQLLNFNNQEAHSSFQRQLQLNKNDINSVEGILITSYRMHNYSSALEEFLRMRASIPVVSQWTILVATVCQAKMGNRQQALAMLTEIDEKSLSYEEEIFYFGVFLILGQEKLAIKLEKALPANSNCPVMSLQRRIVAMISQQRVGNTAKASEILQSAATCSLNLIPQIRYCMAYHQLIFLLNYLYSRNRLKEGRSLLRNTQQNITQIFRDSCKIKEQLLKQMSLPQEVEIELVFR